MTRYLVLGATPELRLDPSTLDANQSEVELLLPLDVFWELQELLQKIRYAQMTNGSSSRQWRVLAHLVHRYVQNERDRLWFAKNVGS